MSQLPSDAKYVSASEIRKRYGVSNSTLRNWAERKLVECVRIGGNEGKGKRFYDFAAVQRHLGAAQRLEEVSRVCVCYARVSSAHQRADLERQIADLSVARPTHEIVSDIGSGLNWKRPGLRSLLERARKGTIAEVVVSHRDRLCRLAFELLEWLLVEQFGVKLVVLSPPAHANGAQPDVGGYDELADDLLAISTFFVAQHNGRRSAAKARERKAKAAEAQAAAGGKGSARPASKRPKDRTSPDSSAAEDSEALV